MWDSWAVTARSMDCALREASEALTQTPMSFFVRLNFAACIITTDGSPSAWWQTLFLPTVLQLPLAPQGKMEPDGPCLPPAHASFLILRTR